MEILEKIKVQLAEIAKQKEQLTSELRKEFYPMLKPLFEKSNGKITSIGWHQYTPHFNDGDECTFSTNFDLDWGIEFNGENLDESELIKSSAYGLQRWIDGDGSYEKWIEKYPDDKIDSIANADEIELYRLFNEVEDLLSCIPDEFYKDLFGDHVKVTVSADGSIETEEYEHD